MNCQIKKWLVFGVKQAVGALAVLMFVASTGCGDAGVSRNLRRLADAPARVVWCRQTADVQDFYARGDTFQLMGFCTEDGLGERAILTEIGSYHKPLLTADGRRVVFTDVPSKTIYVVNWDGSGLCELASGLADDVWQDPDTGIEWVYSFPNSTSVPVPSSPLVRFQLDNPAMEEVVYSATKVSADQIQLSGDGAYLCIQYPWPRMGRLNTQTGEVIPSGKGCWPSMAPDDTYLMWIFDGPHRNLVFHSFDGKERWVVNINHAPGIDGFEVYHPRWSNLDRFMSMSGPYRQGIKNTTGGVNIYIGRFNRILTEVEQWVQLTNHEKSDYYPDVWVEPGIGRHWAVDESHLGEVAPIDHIKERLVVNARLLEVTPTPTLEEIAPYTQTLVVYRYKLEKVLEGAYSEKHLLVAHWGIVNGETIDMPMNIGDQVRLELEKYENRSELEGERLVMDLSNMHDPLFYDLKGR